MAEPLSGGSRSSTAAWERTPGHPTASAADFPQDMGRLFNNNNMGRDALYALSNVLQISAASQRHLLSVLWGLLDAEMDLAGQVPSSAAPMSSVCYLKKVADRHIGRLASTVLILENREQHGWPRAPPRNARERRSRQSRHHAPAGLLQPERGGAAAFRQPGREHRVPFQQHGLHGIRKEHLQCAPCRAADAVGDNLPAPDIHLLGLWHELFAVWPRQVEHLDLFSHRSHRGRRFLTGMVL